MDRNQDQNAFVKKMEAQTEQFVAELKKARARGKEKAADAEIEWSKQIDQLEEGVEDVRKQLSSVAEAGEEAWRDAAENFKDAFADLQKQLSDARNRM